MNNEKLTKAEKIKYAKWVIRLQRKLRLAIKQMQQNPEKFPNNSYYFER